MNIKDVVFQDYQGIRRYGVVKKKYMIERWAHVEVDWVNDAQYEEAMIALAKLRNSDLSRYVYRIDEIRRINPDKEVQTLKDCIRRAKI
tara:strand:- start:100 stop:366 length:267 start_codon:yes stop_codon:yes gene_type:complete